MVNSLTYLCWVFYLVWGVCTVCTAVSVLFVLCTPRERRFFITTYNRLKLSECKLNRLKTFLLWYQLLNCEFCCLSACSLMDKWICCCCWQWETSQTERWTLFLHHVGLWGTGKGSPCTFSMYRLVQTLGSCLLQLGVCLSQPCWWLQLDTHTHTHTHTGSSNYFYFESQMWPLT